MNSDQSRNQTGSLEQAYEEFKASRDQLNGHLNSTESLLTEQFSEKLSPQFSAALQETLKLENVKQKINQLYNGNQAGTHEKSKPSIIIVGQTKSGKSSFINELLGSTYVAQSQSPCTARVTRLTYSNETYVLIRSKSGKKIGDVKYLEKPVIEEELVKLKDEDRENEELISSTVEAGIKCEFLRHGIDIIDSPGLNENSSLDSLTLGAIDSFLPIIIYVIDSNSGVTVAAQQDLMTIKKCALGAEVFYLVTKMDVSKETETEEGRPADEIENEKAKRVFTKLQRLGYISQSDTIDTCSKFLCVSCWETRKFRRKKEMMEKKRQKAQPGAQPTANDQKLLNEIEEMRNSKWVRHFEMVKLRILNFAQDQFKGLIEGAGSSLRSVHCQILTMFMDKAHNIRESNNRKKKAIENIKTLASQIHEESKLIVDRHRKNFLDEARRFFGEIKPVLIDEVKSLSYSQDIIQENMSQSDIESRCIREIQTFINERIVITFSAFLRDGALKGCFQEFESLRKQVAEYEKDIEQTPAYQLLKQTLLEGYEMTDRNILHGTLKLFITNLRFAVRALFTQPGVFLSREVKNPKWKEHHADLYLSSISKTNLVNCLVASLKEWFDHQHDAFLNNIQSSEKLVESCMELTEKERMEIKTLYPKVAQLHMSTLDVVTRYKYRGFQLDVDGNIGSGGQGEVFRVLDENGSPALAAKRVVCESSSTDDIAIEVYHSSIFDHKNLVQVVGVKLSKQGSRWTVELYMELMHCDVWNLMQKQRLPVKQRLWIGLELAKALQFLHSNDLIHRDVKLANLLVNEDLSQVKLADFGIAKCTGFVNRTVVGTPIYMAPEIVKSEEISTSADIFSLGIALWYLFEGSGERHPLYARIMPNIGAILVIGAIGMRPEPLQDMPSVLWALMSACWSDNAEERPTAGKVAQVLQSIINSF